jgi:hypothetical protein
MKNEKLKIKNGICALRAIGSTAGGGRAKTPPEAVKQLSAGHSFSFSFFIFRFSFLLYFFVPYSRTASYEPVRECRVNTRFTPTLTWKPFVGPILYSPVLVIFSFFAILGQAPRLLYRRNRCYWIYRMVLYTDR